MILFMGDPRTSLEATPFSLPPGCRFYPSEQQLLYYYLTTKNASPPQQLSSNAGGNSRGFDLIRELDLFDYDPYELPDDACFSYGYGGRRRHWYCYTARDGKERVGRRRAKGGYWKRRGGMRNVVGLGGKVAGTRTRFVFYLGNSAKSAIRTDWIMYVYALVDNVKAAFVLCRVFVKSTGVNGLPDHGLSSCGEESVSAMRDTGIRHDANLASGIVVAKMDDDNLADRKNEISRHPRVINKFDDQGLTRPVAVYSLQLPGIQANELVFDFTGTFKATSSGLMDDMCDDMFSDDQLLSILEEDFIELDDLAYPLPGAD